MIQLRVRSEFSFKQAFGPMKLLVQSLKDMKCEAAAIVDGGTWGHVKFQAACKAVGIKPLFGTEIAVPQPDGRRPVCWVLAEDTNAFYQLSSAARAEGADVLKLLREAKGVIRFAGSALTDPSCFDYVDLNPASPLQRAAAMRLAKETDKPLVVTSDNFYPRLEDKSPFIAMGGRIRATPQHILSYEELRHEFRSMDLKTWDGAIANVNEIAARCASELPTAPLIKVEGNLRKVVEAGRKSRLKRGHLSAWTPEYGARLRREIEAIEAKEYESYFLVVADLINWAKQRMLVGPGRGSSAGSLLCYLTGITEVDPIPNGLLFERFIDLTRKDLPDIDIDFNDQKRELVMQYLSDKYGRANVARIGNINTFKPKSLLAQVCKMLGIADHERFNLVNVLIEYSSGDSRYGKGIEDTLSNTDVGRRFREKFPESVVVTQIENHASHTGVHAAGVIVSNEPVANYCTVGPDGVAQVDKPDAEALNLLKIDALGLRTLGVIEDAGCVTNEELYSLKLDDPKVFEIFNKHRFSSVFQFEGTAQRQVSSQVEIDSFKAIDHVTALARPGPLGGGASGKYIARKAGREPIETSHPMLDEMLRDTYGVVLYQEQVMRIVREIGKFSWEDTTVIRKAMSGRKGKEFFDQKGGLFVKGAAESGISARLALQIWNEICTFGAWGMNMSHTCSYAVISYWCAWMKVYHPMEYAAACLRGAKDDEGRIAVLREMAREGIHYIPFDPEHSAMDWSVKDGKLLGGFLNFHGVGPAKAKNFLAQRDAGKLDVDALRVRHELKFADLYPLHTKYAEWYYDPVKMGCEEGSEILTSDKFPAEGKVLYIGRIVDKRPLDDNETVRVAKRGGVLRTGNTLFIDFRCQDDFGETMICRVDRFNWENFGNPANEALSVGDDVLIRGRRVPGFAMINVFKMMCLNKPGLQWAVTPRAWHNR